MRPYLQMKWSKTANSEAASHHLKLSLWFQSCICRLQVNTNTGQTPRKPVSQQGTAGVSQHRRCENPACIKCCSGTASAAKPLLRAAHGKTNGYYTYSSKKSVVLHWQQLNWSNFFIWRMMCWFKIGLSWLVYSCFTTVPFLWANKASVLSRCLDCQSHRISNFKLRNRLQEKVISCFEKNFHLF